MTVPRNVASKAVRDLAAYIIAEFAPRPVETLKLQKLLYYCQGWSLAYFHKPLFDDRIEAWKHGPVLPGVYQLHKYEAAVSDWPHGSALDITDEGQIIADAVISSYGERSGWALRELTHEEGPWSKAWERAQHGKIREVEIEQSEIESFFVDLAKAARANN